MADSIVRRVKDNYSLNSMLDRIQQSLEQAGFGSGPLKWTDLVTFDQFHVRGLDATKELAEALQLVTGQALLDLGSGLGGPARFFAAVCGVHVTGVDITPALVEVASYLSSRAGLDEKTAFSQGDATELSFDDCRFDAVITQHVAMNIPDKAKLYRGAHRVLKHGGQFAIYDAIVGSGEPVHYPTPWARDESMSFLATEDEMHQLLSSAGFTVKSYLDRSETAIQWFQAAQRAPQEQAGPPNPLGAAAILGPTMGPAVMNFARNILEGRVRVVQYIAEKA